jgi:hypothetical protein
MINRHSRLENLLLLSSQLDEAIRSASSEYSQTENAGHIHNQVANTEAILGVIITIFIRPWNFADSSSTSIQSANRKQALTQEKLRMAELTRELYVFNTTSSISTSSIKLMCHHPYCTQEGPTRRCRCISQPIQQNGERTFFSSYGSNTT